MIATGTPIVLPTSVTGWFCLVGLIVSIPTSIPLTGQPVDEASQMTGIAAVRYLPGATVSMVAYTAVRLTALT